MSTRIEGAFANLSLEDLLTVMRTVDSTALTLISKSPSLQIIAVSSIQSSDPSASDLFKVDFKSPMIRRTLLRKLVLREQEEMVLVFRRYRADATTTT